MRKFNRLWMRRYVRRECRRHLNKAHVLHSCCACIPIRGAVPANQQVSRLAHTSERMIDTALSRAREANPAVWAITAARLWRAVLGGSNQQRISSIISGELRANSRSARFTDVQSLNEPFFVFFNSGFYSRWWAAIGAGQRRWNRFTVCAWVKWMFCLF